MLFGIKNDIEIIYRAETNNCFDEFYKLLYKNKNK